MTVEETAKLLTYISSIWPRTWQGIKGGEAAVIKTWADLLEDIPAGAALAAVRAHAATSEWAPTISDIRKAATVPMDVQDWSGCYHEIMTAIRKYGWTDASDGMATLSPMARIIAERIGWREICQSDEGDAAIRAHVMRIHEGLMSREIKKQLIPLKVQEQLRRMTGGVQALPEGDTT